MVWLSLIIIVVFNVIGRLLLNMVLYLVYIFKRLEITLEYVNDEFLS